MMQYRWCPPLALNMPGFPHGPQRTHIPIWDLIELIWVSSDASEYAGQFNRLLEVELPAAFTPESLNQNRFPHRGRCTRFRNWAELNGRGWFRWKNQATRQRTDGLNWWNRTSKDGRHLGDWDILLMFHWRTESCLRFWNSNISSSLITNWQNAV